MAAYRPRLHFGNVLIAAGLILLTPASSRENAPTPPSILFDGLYQDVAASGIFADFKTFADAIPKKTPTEILAAYRANHPKSPAALKQFIEANFSFDQGQNTIPLPPPGLPMMEHIARLWPHLTQNSQSVPPYSSALPLPEPYVVPGGRFHELYYWDSYFTMVGFGPEQAQLRQNTIDDFVSELHLYGHIPNGSRDYYLSRSQPPFFFEMVALTSPGNEATAYARYLLELKLEYAYWMADADKTAPGKATRHVVRMHDGSLLNRYWDERGAPRDEVYPVDVRNTEGVNRDREQMYHDIRATAESGWDFSSRWFADSANIATIETTSLAPADLNSILYGLERAIESGCRERHDDSCARDFANNADRRRITMNKYLWNGSYFADYRWTSGQRKDQVTAAVYYPLFFHLATKEQADKTQQAAEPALFKSGGLVTTTYETGQQWDAPNGWAPLQWIAVVGLRNYNENAPARTLACRWIGNVARVYKDTGKLKEKYNVESLKPGGGGEYPLQDGFGWTNGVTAALSKLYPDCDNLR